MTESKINDSGLETFKTHMMAFIDDQRFDHRCSDNGNIYNNPFITTQSIYNHFTSHKDPTIASNNCQFELICPKDSGLRDNFGGSLTWTDMFGPISGRLVVKGIP